MAKIFQMSDHPQPIESLARTLSFEQDALWYVMERSGSDPIAVNDADYARFARLGYKVRCCYFAGDRHSNAFRDVQNRRYIFTE